MRYICINCHSTEPTLLAVIPQYPLFSEGFWLHWMMNKMEHIPDDLNITLTVHVGDRQWEISDPNKLSEFVELPLEDGSVQVNITMSVGNIWTDTIPITVTPLLGKSVFISSPVVH